MRRVRIVAHRVININPARNYPTEESSALFSFDTWSLLYLFVGHMSLPFGCFVYRNFARIHISVNMYACVYTLLVMFYCISECIPLWFIFALIMFQLTVNTGIICLPMQCRFGFLTPSFKYISNFPKYLSKYFSNFVCPRFCGMIRKNIEYIQTLS